MLQKCINYVGRIVVYADCCIVKMKIAKDYLITNQQKNNGVTTNKFS